MLRTLSIVALALLVGSAAGARHLASSPTASQQSVTEYIASQPDLHIFSAAIEAVNAAEEYNTASPGFTVFAPNDAAFESLADTLNITMDSLLNSSLILPIVQYSASSQPVRITDFSNNQNLLTLLVPQSVTIEMLAAPAAASEVSTQSIAPAAMAPSAMDTITVVGANSQASIISADAQVGMTFIYVVDEVLLPALEVSIDN